MKSIYSRTIKAAHLGYIVQAIIVNFLPLLFVYFNTHYNIPMYLITLIITYSFVIQMLIDYNSSKITLKIGYKKAIMLADILAAIGLILAGITPYLFHTPITIYIGIIISLTLMSIGGGLTEVIISPIIELLPLENKASNMSLLHSFYCIGHMFTIIVATIFFKYVGIEFWSILSISLSIIPIIDFILFFDAPVVQPANENTEEKAFSVFKLPYFFIFFILILCAGAVEQAIAQWISYFAEQGLSIDKTLGDLLGTLIFALFMFIARFSNVYIAKKIDLSKLLIVNFSLLILCFLSAVFIPNNIVSLILFALSGLFIGSSWPNVYSITTKSIPEGGTIMFSMIALGGDIGCTLGPSIVGLVSNFSNIKMGILFATIFPLTFLICLIILKKKKIN